MPIYEYECAKCGVFEVNQRITEDPLRKCPTCRSKVKKLISSTSFQLKGSGWYVTDYARKDGGGKESKASKESGKESKESKEAKTDLASASASDTSSKSGDSGKSEDSGKKKGGSKTTNAAAA